MSQTVKNLPAIQETQVWSLGQEDHLGKGMATHSSILAWRMPWTEEPGGLQFLGSHSGTQLSDSHFDFSLSVGLVDISPLYRHSSIISELLGNFSLPTWESDSVGPVWGPGISGDFLKKSLQVILMSSWSGEALACFSWQVVPSLAVTLWRVTGRAGSGWYRALTRGWLTSPAHTASVLRLWEKKKNYVAYFIPHGIFY